MPNSGRSDARGLKAKLLPAYGYDGDVPDFPQPVVHGHELFYWDWAWKQSVAWLWATPQYAHLLMQIADWCSMKAQVEDPEAPASVRAAIRQREGDILLTNDSLKREGYSIAANEMAEHAAAKSPSADEYDPRAEFKSVQGGR